MESINLESLFTVYAVPALWALIIFIVGRIAARFITKAITKVMTKREVDPTLVKFTANFTYIALLVFVILAALEQLGINTTSFAAVLAAAGLAVGLALQGSLSNFASGIMLIIFRPFKVRDFIKAGGVEGVVEEIQIFTTKLTSPDNKSIILPNGQVTSGEIINYTAKDTRRVDMVFGVGYDDDLKKVRSVLEEILSADERILKDPAPTIGVLELGDSSVNFAVRPWVRTADYWNVYFHLHETAKLRFDQEGISIPYPQRDLHIVSGNLDAA